MVDLLIAMWYEYIANILMTRYLIECVPKLEIVSVKRYRGQIEKRGKTFIKIKISRLDFDTENNTDIINTICHEFAHMEYWEHGEEHTNLTIEYMRKVYEQLRKDNDIQKSNEKEMTKMYEQITIKELVKLLDSTIKEMLDIDIILTNDTVLYDLEPVILIHDNRVLKCLCETEIYLNNVDRIRVFTKDNKIKCEYQVEKVISSSRITKKDLEIMLLQDLLNNKDTKIVELNKKIKDLEKSNAELNRSLKEIPKNKTGRKPYNNTKVIEIVRNLRLEGNGYLEIANRLNSMNLLTDKNKLWGASSIKCIIKRHIEKS